jgi:hypothetical protein
MQMDKLFLTLRHRSLSQVLNEVDWFTPSLAHTGDAGDGMVVAAAVVVLRGIHACLL